MILFMTVQPTFPVPPGSVCGCAVLLVFPSSKSAILCPYSQIMLTAAVNSSRTMFHINLVHFRQSQEGLFVFKINVLLWFCSVAHLYHVHLWSNGLQHARLPCPSPSPGACSNSCPLSRWWHPTVSSSVVPFSSCLQYFPTSGSFPMSRLITAGGQRIGTSASASVLPMNIQGWFPLVWWSCSPRNS